MPLYPLKFNTIYKEKLWGGNKIKNVLGKDYGDLSNCGETWELSGVEGNISEVAEGAFSGRDLKSLIQEHRGDLVGKRIYDRFGDDFPLLIKFIDADQDLSIQVHPDDDLARKRHNSFGKTEMWYVMQADPGASLISGFNREVNQKEYMEIFHDGRLSDILNREDVKAGDVFFLPAGRIHTIGKGLLIAEIQQTSDITYRIYDFDRVDSEGNKRDLHVEEALDAIDYNFYEEYKTSYEDEPEKAVNLVKCPYFTTNKLSLTKPVDLSRRTDSFTVYINLEGNCTIKSNSGEVRLSLGDVVLIPAIDDKIRIEPEGDLVLLESYIEP